MRYLLRCALVCSLFAASGFAAAPPQPVVVNAVPDVYRSFPPDQQKFGGLIGNRLVANSEGYIERIPLASLDPAKESTGIFLDAVVYTYEYNRSPHENAVMLQVARKMISSVGTATSGESVGAEDGSPAQVAAQSADLRALLNYYRVTGDQSAFSAATAIGNQLVAARHHVKDASQLAVSIEPMLHLFRFTDEKKYLDFCTAVADAWIKGKPPELAVTSQNLTVLNGLVELYRIDGDNFLLKVPLDAWTQMQASGFALTGIPVKLSAADPNAFDACTTGAWLQLSLNLLRINGQAVYSEELERMLYNQVFAGQDLKTGSVLAPVTWAASKRPANGSACAASEVRALAQIPSIVWGRYGNGIAVNLYTDGRTTVNLRRRGAIQLFTETNYPEMGSALLHVEPEHPIRFPLRLRVPDWATDFTADVDQDHFVGKPGDFLTLNRNWKKGDTVKVQMSLKARFIPGAGQFTGDVAVARGPQVLALGKSLNPQVHDLSAATIDPLDESSSSLPAMATNFAANWMGDQAYSIPGAYDGQPRKLVLVPFADAMNYRVWLAQSKVSSGASGR